jgi:hypothetical protein
LASYKEKNTFLKVRKNIIKKLGYYVEPEITCNFLPPSKPQQDSFFILKDVLDESRAEILKLLGSLLHLKEHQFPIDRQFFNPLCLLFKLPAELFQEILKEVVTELIKGPYRPFLFAKDPLNLSISIPNHQASSKNLSLHSELTHN